MEWIFGAIGVLVGAGIVLGVNAWYFRNRWPANGFVKVPKSYAEDAQARAARSDALAQDRTTTEPYRPGRTDNARVRTARMSGRRRINTRRSR